MLDVSLLGTSGMVPMPNRFLSSMIARHNGRMIVIDCGEGTQISLKNLGWGFKNIDAIMFTHYHADHISGLPGMLLALTNAGREKPLKLIGPKGLVYIVEGLRRIAQELSYEVEYIELDENNTTPIVIEGFTVNYMFVEHSVKCIAYSLEIKRIGKFNVNKATALKIPKNMWGELQKKGEINFENNIYTRDMVVDEGRKGIKVSFCTDSRPVEKLPNFIENSDLFICEGMYGENEKLPKAMDNKHMLFSEAANLAKDGDVKKLWLTHFSPALSEPEEFLFVATEIFPNTEIGYDNMCEKIYFDNE